MLTDKGVIEYTFSKQYARGKEAYIIYIYARAKEGFILDFAYIETSV